MKKFALKEKTCCFTGHRMIPKEKENEIVGRLDVYVKKLIAKGVKFCGVGGAIGFDTLVSKHLFHLRDTENLDIKVILVCPFEGFTNRWNEKQQQTFDSLLPQYDKVIYKEKFASREAYLSRNRHLVDYSAYCIAYCEHDAGGTAYTVRYAIRNAVSILNIADYDVNCLSKSHVVISEKQPK